MLPISSWYTLLSDLCGARGGAVVYISAHSSSVRLYVLLPNANLHMRNNFVLVIVESPVSKHTAAPVNIVDFPFVLIRVRTPRFQPTPGSGFELRAASIFCLGGYRHLDLNTH